MSADIPLIQATNLNLIKIKDKDKDWDTKAKQASQLYEKHFLREMIKEMRKTIPTSGLFKPSLTEDIFREQLDGEYVEVWGDKGGLGLSDLIYNQLKEKFSNDKMAQPKGPIPISQEKNIQWFQKKENNDQKKSNQINLGANNMSPQQDLLNPWDGTLISKKKNGAWSQVEIAHNDGPKSCFTFPGAITLKEIGSELIAGERLGQIPLSKSSFWWTVQG